jgi:hypothetical protein
MLAMARLTGNWRNLPVIEGQLLHQDQENWVAITRDWAADEYLPWVRDLQGLGRTHAFVGAIEAKALETPAPDVPATATDLWRRYFDRWGSSDPIAQMLEDSFFDLGEILATYWVRALWDFLVKATNHNLARPPSLVKAVPCLLDLKELVRLLRIPLAKGEIAQSCSVEHMFVWPSILEGGVTFGWRVLDRHGEQHHIDRAYLAEQLLRCLRAAAKE